jgi:hypothetical protein
VNAVLGCWLSEQGKSVFMSDPNWIPVAVLPNLYTRRTVEGEIVALAPAPDARIQAFLSAHPKFGEFLSRFTDTFHVPLDPVVLIVREEAIPKIGDTQGALLSFRDLVTLSVVPHARSHGLVYGRSDRIMYANSFWLHPWMIDNDTLAASTPAFAGVHVVEEFHGQASPELPVMQLDELDDPLFEALLVRWKRHYLGKRQRWQDRALFRSLNMAGQAAQLPAGMGTTLYDLGRIAALWVSAFEILAHLARIAPAFVTSIRSLSGCLISIAKFGGGTTLPIWGELRSRGHGARYRAGCTAGSTEDATRSCMEILLAPKLFSRAI